MVKIGHAVHDEHNKAKGGDAGDQTGGEVLIANWYNKPWTNVFRAKDPDAAEKIAETSEAICKNNYIGYDQGQRTTLDDEARKVGYDIEKITAPCETDCSAKVAVCVNAAGIKVSKYMFTGSELTVLRNTSKFDIFTTDDYCKSPDKLRRGDILLGKGHTAVVLSDGDKAYSEPIEEPEEEPVDDPVEQEPENPLTGTGIGIATAKGSMHIRAKTTSKSKSYGIVRRGDQLEVLDILPNGWYKVVWDEAKDGYAYTSNVDGKYYQYDGEIPDHLAEPEQEGTGSKYILTGNYNLRRTPGAEGKQPGDIIVVVHQGSFFTPDGESAMIGDTEWLHGSYGSFTGWISTKGLRKY